MNGARGDDEMDRMLLRENEILPSSGFVVSVMEAVRREAVAPPPIPFPWKRVLPGLVVAGAVLVTIVVVLVGAHAGTVPVPRADSPSSAVLSLGPSLFGPSLLHGGIESAATWIVLALVTAFVSVKISIGLAFGRA
jgi:hypothetical protein